MILVANLATTFQDLVAKVKNLVALAPVLGAISRPGSYMIRKSLRVIMENQSPVLQLPPPRSD